jgi:hypothetical protein
MLHVANVDFPRGRSRARRLGVTAQTQIRIALRQQLSIQRSVRVVTHRAAFTQREVLKNHRAGLFAVTLRAILVRAGHRQAARRFENVSAMWVVALYAIHPALDDRMVLRQMKLRFDFNMALKTRRWIPAGIDDEFGRPARRDVFAAWAVAGFATLPASHGVPP